MISISPTTGLAMPTDADWGRLYNFNTVGDSGLVMPFRSYYFREFVPGAWTDLAIGLIYSNCGNAGDESTLHDERLASSTPANVFHFGLSHAEGRKINVATNPKFLGLRGQIGSNPQIIAASKIVTRNFLTLVNGGAATMTGAAYDFNLTEGVSGTPFNMIGLRFIHDPVNGIVYANRAVSNGISVASEADNVTQLDAFLRGITNNIITPHATFGMSSTVDFSTYYLFWPYLLNKLKLQCVGAIKLG